MMDVLTSAGLAENTNKNIQIKKIKRKSQKEQSSYHRKSYLKLSVFERKSVAEIRLVIIN